MYCDCSFYLIHIFGRLLIIFTLACVLGLADLQMSIQAITMLPRPTHRDIRVS